MPAEYPDYPSQEQVLEYFRSYVRHFDLEPHIAFNTPSSGSSAPRKVVGT